MSGMELYNAGVELKALRAEVVRLRTALDRPVPVAEVPHYTVEECSLYLMCTATRPNTTPEQLEGLARSMANWLNVAYELGKQDGAKEALGIPNEFLKGRGVV